jgi:hypothetical protein
MRHHEQQRGIVYPKLPKSPDGYRSFVLLYVLGKTREDPSIS